MSNEGESEAIILVKAASQQGMSVDEAVYCAGVTPQGEWVRLYPVTFRRGNDVHHFKRWDHIRFRWRSPSGDPRPESRRVDQNSIEVIGELSPSQRFDFLSRLEVTHLHRLSEQGKSLALLRPRNPRFFVERKTETEINEEQQLYGRFQRETPSEANMLKPQKPCPYRFKYKYSDDDGDFEGVYQDWGVNAAFASLSEAFGEAQTLARIVQVLGKEYPKKGMVFALDANPRDREKWQINAIICLDEVCKVSGTSLDVVT